MKNLEKLTKQIYDECLADGEPVTMEEATEMAKAEIGAKDVIGYTATEKTKGKSKPHTVKVSNEKKNLFGTILTNLNRCPYVSRDDIRVLKDNKLIEVRIGDKIFKVDIVEQRPPKKI